MSSSFPKQCFIKENEADMVYMSPTISERMIIRVRTRSQDSQLTESTRLNFVSI